MGPPPTPIDPTLESYNAAPAPNVDLDQLLLPSPKPQQKPHYPREINLASIYQENQVPSLRPSHLDIDPEINSYPDPWDPQRVNQGVTRALMNPNHTNVRERMYQPGPPGNVYWDARTHRSDIDSSTGRHLHDSGYHSQTHGTASIFSGDLGSNQESRSISGGMTSIELRREQIPFEAYPEPPSLDCTNGFPDQYSEIPLDLACRICDAKSRNKSEFKYVLS